MTGPIGSRWPSVAVFKARRCGGMPGRSGAVIAAPPSELLHQEAAIDPDRLADRIGQMTLRRGEHDAGDLPPPYPNGVSPYHQPRSTHHSGRVRVPSSRWRSGRAGSRRRRCLPARGGPRRAASIAAAALEAQYSPRWTEAATALDEVTRDDRALPEARRRPRADPAARAKAWVRKNVPRGVDGDAAIEALWRDVEEVAALQHRDAGIVDQGLDSGPSARLDRVQKRRVPVDVGDVGRRSARPRAAGPALARRSPSSVAPPSARSIGGDVEAARQPAPPRRHGRCRAWRR